MSHSDEDYNWINWKYWEKGVDAGHPPMRRYHKKIIKGNPSIPDRNSIVPGYQNSTNIVVINGNQNSLQPDRRV